MVQAHEVEYNKLLSFRNSILNSDLKVEEVDDPHEVRQVRGFNFTKVPPTPLIAPYVAAVSDPCMKMIGLENHKQLDQAQLAEYLSGNKLWEGSTPLSHCYCGFQFGYFSGQLGDGRAISLGDVAQNGPSDLGPEGTLLDLQLKGAGLTPYSRSADGRAVLRSSVREFLASEAMYYLGVPTTRAASLVVSDRSKVKRDKLYDGNPEMEKCAVVMRVAPTFFRFGSFEIFLPVNSLTHRQGPSYGLKDEMLPPMLNYLITNFYPHIAESFPDSQESNLAMRAQVMFEELVQSTAKMVALWQCYGFCHGVLNTDNMSMLGLTIDYGPYGFMEHYDPLFICNNSDDQGRYRYEAQPSICKWNLDRLADALDPIVPAATSKSFLEQNYQKFYDEVYKQRLAEKLGLTDDGQEVNMLTSEEDKALVNEFWDVMRETGSDFTNTFRDLASVTKSPDMTPQDEQALSKILSHAAPKSHHLSKVRSKYEGNEKLIMIAQQQPALLRLYGHDPDEILESVEQARKSRDQVNQNFNKIQSAYRGLWQEWILKYKQRLAGQVQTDATRAQKMNKVNPRFVLRNYLLQQAIEKAEESGDMSGVENLLDLASRPFDEPEDKAVCANKPDWAFKLCVSCSS